MGDYNVTIGADFTGQSTLDGIKKQIDSLTSNTHTVKIDLNISNLSSINNIRNQLTNTLTQSGRAAGVSFSNALNNAIIAKKPDLGGSQIADMQRTLASMKINRSDIANITNDLQNMQLQIRNIRTEFSGDGLGNIRMTVQGIDQVNNAITVVKQFEQATGNISTVSKTISQSFDNIDTTKLDSIISRFNSGAFNVDLSSLETAFASLNTQTDGVTNNVNEVRAALDSLGMAINSGDVNGIISSYETFQTTLRNTAREVAKLGKEEKLSLQKNVFQEQINQWRQMYSAALPKFGLALDQIEAKLQTVDASGLQRLKEELRNLTLQAKNAGLATKTLGEKFKSSFSKIGTYFSGYQLFMKSVQTLKNMGSNVLKVDSAMTELYRVTDLSSSKYDQMYEQMTASAKKYGSTLDGIISTTASWVKLGFNENDSVKLAELTSQYQHVTDLDEATAVNNLVTAYKGFESQLLEVTGGDSVKAVERIEDIYDLLGNKFAESAANVGEGLSKAASVLSQAGASIEQSAGM